VGRRAHRGTGGRVREGCGGEARARVREVVSERRRQNLNPQFSNPKNELHR